MLEVSFKLNGFDSEFKVGCEDIHEAEALRDYFGDNVVNGTFTIWDGRSMIRYETFSLADFNHQY